MNIKVFVYDKKTNKTLLTIAGIREIRKGEKYLEITDAMGYIVNVDPKVCKTRIYKN